jgi:alpha-beta hydrolase superfamily lysophospholipase
LADPVPFTFTAGDGYLWRGRRWDPPGPVRGSVVGLHGIQSHGGWYLQTGERLAAAGYVVVFPDRRGCGENLADRGDAPCGFRRMLDDLGEFLPTLPRPRFVMGISWGGKLAAALQRRHPGLTDGLILVAPGFCPRVRPPLGQRLRVLLARLFAPTRQFPIPLNEPELFTANPERQWFIAGDPLALRKATARLIAESVRLDVYLRFAAKRVTVPVMLLLAERDRIIDNAATRRFVAHFASADVSAIEYLEAHHTLEFEPGGPPFLGDVVGWLRKRACLA